MRILLSALLLTLATVSPLAAMRHELGQSYIFLRVYDDSIEVRVELTVDDLDRVLHFGWNSEDGVAREVLAARIDSILAYVRPRFSVGLPGGGTLPLRYVRHDLRELNIADYVMLHFMIDGLTTLPAELEVWYPIFFDIDSQHRNILVIEHNWRTSTFNDESNVALIFAPSSARQTLDLSKSTVLRGFIGFVWLGVWHIWIGLDHILFLMALIFPAVLRRRDGRWEPVPGFRPALMNLVGIVTAFTVAHSITLSLAALNIVRLPARPVEAIIALSIAAAALYNLYRPFDVREWAIAFVFGLFHGFGFANVLGDIGLESGFLALSLLGFNLGVELGQIAIIVAVFPLLYALRARPIYVPVLRYGSALLIALAMVWFIERAFDVPLTSYARRAPGYLYRNFIAQV